MSKNRFFLIIGVVMIVAATVFATRIYEFKINQEYLSSKTTLKNSSFALYHNKVFNYNIIYPTFLTLQDDAPLSFVNMDVGTTLTFPDSMTTSTNLGEAKILLGRIKDGFGDDNCLPKEGEIFRDPTMTVNINGLKFYKNSFVGAGLGNRWETINYATKDDGKCFNITLWLHSTVLENYPPELGLKQFDRDKFIMAFEFILANFSKNK
jgi:hypothetical protein